MLVNHRPRSLTTLGYVIECDGVQIRAQLRSVATLVRVTGCIGPSNVDLVLIHLRRFSRLQGPLVLDLLGADGFDDALLGELIHTVTAGSDVVGAAVTLVVDSALRDTMAPRDGVDVVDSVGEALRDISARIRARRAPVFMAPKGA
jgi:hypothetical protein